ncbi:FadR/GntR family transcriptional regulator [Rhodococcoides navarretei]|uniref:FCD domain-containing protein n=1 Tax=Rhodococcus navarretei TaxID=3128981 RepID=A0ABU9CQU7_9NOCA
MTDMADDAGRAQNEPLSWKPVRRARAHELVIDAIEERIMAGDLRVGDPLPPEREFAAQLDVSRAGVREAVRVLESSGILRSSPGSGPGAGTFVAALPRPALTRLLRLHVALANFRIDDLISTRVALERASVHLAAVAPDQEKLEQARNAVDIMAARGVTREVFNDADTNFHIALAEASGNDFVASLTAAIRESMRAPILAALLEIEDWDSLADTLNAEHRQILAAVEAGDAELAMTAAEEHIRSSAAALSIRNKTDPS